MRIIAFNIFRRKQTFQRILKRVFWLLIRTCFSPSQSTRPKRAPLKGTQRREPLPKESVGLFREGCEILEKAPGFRRYSYLCQYFQEKVEIFYRILYSTSECSSTQSPTTVPPAYHSLAVLISICHPTVCFVYVVSSGPLWPTFCNYKL